MCIYSLTDYMLLVSDIHITLVTEGSSLVGGYEWRMKKMIVNPPSMLVERQCVIY